LLQFKSTLLLIVTFDISKNGVFEKKYENSQNAVDQQEYTP